MLSGDYYLRSFLQLADIEVNIAVARSSQLGMHELW